MNEDQDLPNIAVSGWAGVGSTSVTLLLAYLLQYDYLPVTTIFRYIDKKLKSNNDLELNKEYEELIQPLIGKTIDNYIDYKLLNSSNTLIESDIAGFRIGKHPKVYSIFIMAEMTEREKRTTKEGRKAKEAPLVERDAVLRQEYQKLWNIDIFDKEQISKKYNLVMDNTEMKIEQELIQIFSELASHPRFKQAYDWHKLNAKIDKAVKDLWEKGKDHYLDKLKQQKLILSTQAIMQEITKEFPEDIAALPNQIQQMFLGID